MTDEQIIRGNELKSAISKTRKLLAAAKKRLLSMEFMLQEVPHFSF